MNFPIAAWNFPRLSPRFFPLAWRLPALIVIGAVSLHGCGGGGNGSSRPALGAFSASATFNVRAVGGQVAEIAAVTPDGNTLLYTDSSTGRIGVVNIADLKAVSQTAFYQGEGEPTSVAVTRDGRFAIAVFAGTNRAVVLNLPALTVARTIELPGQPDSVAVSPDGDFAAIAIENQRDEDLGGGALPQSPSGSLYVLNLGADVSKWTGRNVALNLPSTLRFPSDAEPEYVDINNRNEAVVSLQENNGVAIVNLSNGSARYFDAGTTTHAADLTDNRPNAAIDFGQTLTSARREPDGVAWTPRGNIITANEGDYDVDLTSGQFVGGRNFTIFSPSGTVLFDERGDLERAVAQANRYDDRRSDAKGTEPENVDVVVIRGRTYAFVALERADSLAVYRLDSDSSPQFLQILPTGDAPEGVVSVPSRNLVITANEGDGTLSFFSAS